jgi:hypothetical protein
MAVKHHDPVPRPDKKQEGNSHEYVKKDFIAMANTFRPFYRREGENVSRAELLGALCSFCHEQNINFMADRFTQYLMGECGPNGGKIKK